MKEEPNYDYLQVILLCIQKVQEPTKKLLELLKYFRKTSGLKKSIMSSNLNNIKMEKNLHLSP